MFTNYQLRMSKSSSLAKVTEYRRCRASSESLAWGRAEVEFLGPPESFRRMLH